MKFLCDNCKAKYQIGDDKVAGKTVRMKCRRCGHLIQVSASVTESSVARRLPTEPGSPQSSSSPKPISSSKPAHPGPMFDRPVDGDESTAIMSEGAPGAAGEHAPASRPGAPRSPVAAGRDAGEHRLPPRPGAPPPGAVRPALAPPRPIGVPRPPVAAVPRAIGSAPRVGGGAAAAASRPAFAPAPVAAPEPSPPPPGALRGAFASALADPPASSATRPGATSTEDWYVGCAGVPLGPIRTSVIREKAAVGAVDGESLVWREGFDEWLPLKKFPELLEIVNEARASSVSGRRSSGPSGFPAVQPYGSPPPAARPAPGREIPAAPRGGPAAPPTTNREAPAAPMGGPAESPSFGRGVAPASLGIDAASPAFNREAPAAPMGGPAESPSFGHGVAAATLVGGIASPAFAPAPFAPPAPAPFAPPAPAPFVPATNAGTSASAPFGVAPAGAPTAPPATGGHVMADPFGSGSAHQSGVAPPAPTPERASVVDPDYVPGRRRMHPMAYALIAMAAVFGGVAAFVLLSPKPPVAIPQIVVLQQGPAPGVVGQAQGQPAGDSDAGIVEIQVGDPTSPQAKGPLGGPWPGRSADPKPGSTAAPLDTSGFGGPSTASGTPAGPSTSTPPPSGLGQLTQGEISGVVESNRAGIRKRCWQPALDGRAKGGPTSVRVSASLVIGPSGNVESVNAGGGEAAFPGLASCIAGRIKGWKFPPSSGSSPVSVPFFFAEQ